MKEYMKPEIEILEFTMEDITFGGGQDGSESSTLNGDEGWGG